MSGGCDGGYFSRSALERLAAVFAWLVDQLIVMHTGTALLDELHSGRHVTDEAVILPRHQGVLLVVLDKPVINGNRQIVTCGTDGSGRLPW